MESTILLPIWETFKQSVRDVFQRMSVLLKAGLLSVFVIAVTFAIGFILMALSFGTGLSGLFNEIAFQFALNQSFSISLVPQTGFETVIFAIVTLLISAVTIYVMSRYVIFTVLALTHREKTFKELFVLSKNNVCKLSGLMFLLSVIVTFTAFPFVIPGLIYTLALSLAIFPIIHENKGIKESLIYSSKITKGSKRKVFVFSILIALTVFASQLALMLYSTVVMLVLEAVSKFIQSDSITLISFVLLFVLLMVGFGIFAVLNTILPIAVLQRVFDTLKQKDVTNVRGMRVWLAAVWVILGLLLFSGLFILARDGAVTHRERLEKAYALNDLNKMKLKGYRSLLQNDVFAKGYVIGVDSKSGMNTFVGGGLSFMYPSAWKFDVNYKNKTNAFAQFRFEKNKTDVSLGIVRFLHNLELDPLITWNPSEFLQTYGVPKLDEEVRNGGIESYRIPRLNGEQNVAVLDITQNVSGVSTKERQYFWFIGPNKYTISVFGEDDKNFEDAYKQVERIIEQSKLDPLIMSYPEIYR